MNPALSTIQDAISKKGGVKFADLHLHTFFSDGTYSPQELIEKSVRCGLSTIAIADHDTTCGVVPAIEAGKDKGIEVIPAIELSSEYEGSEIHLLGYFIDYKNEGLIAVLKRLRQNRIERVYKIIAKLSDMGVNLEAEKVFELAKNGTVGRLHIARTMLQEKTIKYINEAFHKYIGDKSPAYVSGFKFSPKEAITLIKESGGVPVLAHPYTLDKDELIPEFVNLGLMGLEVYYPEHSQSMINFYLDIAIKYNLVVTGGSDCHGQAKPEAKIGSIKLPYEFVEKLKKAREKV